MKKLLILTALTMSLIGCAKESDDNTAEEIDSLKTRVAQLETSTRANNQSIVSLNARLKEANRVLADVENQLFELAFSNNATSVEIGELRFMIETMQVMITIQQEALAQLSTNLPVVTVIDFCGPAEGQFNEVGFRMSDGSTVVYFESGGNRFLSVLKPSTSYATTDGTGCSFTTDAAGLVCDNLGCR